MNELKLGLRENRTEFRPGEAIAGAAGWKLDGPAEAVEVRLGWRTEGKGTTDTQIVQTVRFDHPEIETARPFSFPAPASPYSFSGKLISLIWSLEMVVRPGKDSTRLDLTLSPTGQEILLHQPA